MTYIDILVRDSSASRIQNANAIVFATINNGFIIRVNKNIAVLIGLISRLANAAAASLQHNVAVILRTDVVHSVGAVHNAHDDVLVGA